MTPVEKLDSLSAIAISRIGSVAVAWPALMMVWTRWRRIRIGPNSRISSGLPASASWSGASGQSRSSGTRSIGAEAESTDAESTLAARGSSRAGDDENRLTRGRRKTPISDGTAACAGLTSKLRIPPSTAASTAAAPAQTTSERAMTGTNVSRSWAPAERNARHSPGPAPAKRPTCSVARASAIVRSGIRPDLPARR